MYKKTIYFIVFSLFLAASCRKDDKLLSGPGNLNFSEDTVYFDTVFTRLPGSNYPRSVNKRFMLRNPYKEKVNVNVRLMGGSNSPFRINVDGLTGRIINDVEVLPEDSAWVFVEATLDANNLTNPSLVRDSIEFETNGNRQYVQLAAYGWDAYYFKDSVFTGNTSLFLKDKPYVIVNTIFVDDGATLTIGPGLHFYSTPNSVFQDTTNKKFSISAINVLGTLKVNGNKSEPVIFEGDRLDNSFKDKPGQWRGIHFYRGSVNNEIRYADIKNATIGLWVDSLPESGTHNLIVWNSRIRNMSAYGILGLTASIKVENTIISNCGANTFLGYYGGNYLINNCTFYNPSNGRRDPHLVFNNILRDENKIIIKTYDLSFEILNSIIWGPLESEIGFDITNDSQIKKSVLAFSIYKSKVNLGGTSNILNKDPLFENVTQQNFKLKSASPAKDKADPNTATIIDFDDKSRDASPDIGAYEI